MRNLSITLLTLIILSCSSSPTASAPDTGGTSIEVAMIKGVVVDEQNRPVEGATVEILSGNGQTLSLSSSTNCDGSFSNEISNTGTVSIVVDDNSGNGAMTTVTIYDATTSMQVDTIRVQKLATLKFQFDFSKIEPTSSDSKKMRVVCRELNMMWQFDSTGVFIEDKQYSDILTIPAGTLNFRLQSWMQSLFEIQDTVITILPGVENTIVLTPKLLSLDTITSELDHDFQTVVQLYADNGIELSSMGDVFTKVGIKNGRVIELTTFDFDILPEYIDQLEMLEELTFIDNTIKTLPATIANLGHLRYLDLCSTSDTTYYPQSIESLPPELLTMQNLQIFSCGFANSISALPELIYEMTQVGTIYPLFTWLPSEREKEWALKRMFHGDKQAYEKWLAELVVIYGTK